MKVLAIRVGRRREAGSVTLASLCLLSVLCIALSTYLSLCRQSTNLSTRSLHQEEARELAQVGIEEALWALNQNQWTTSGPNGASTWTTTGSNCSVTLSYSLPGQNASGQVTLSVTNYNSAGPTWPSISSAATLTLPSGQTFTSTLQASTEPAPLFGNAIASSESYVSFVAAGTVDSWNSDPDNNPATPAVPYSFTAGSPANHNAVIAAEGNGTFGVVLTQATVRGYVTTFGLPISYSTSGSPVGRVVGPVTATGVNVDAARLGKSAFVPTIVFAVNLPATNGPNFGGLINNALALVAALLLPSPTANVYKTSGNLDILGIPLLAPSLTIDRPLKLIVNGSLNISGLGRITVTPSGSLELFVTGDVNIAGNGLINQTQDPKKLALFCTSSSTANALEYNTSADFCGVIYCENKPIDIRRNATFYGALLSRQYVRFSNSATAPVFHYDTALRKVRFSQVSTPYLVHRVMEI